MKPISVLFLFASLLVLACSSPDNSQPTENKPINPIDTQVIPDKPVQGNTEVIQDSCITGDSTKADASLLLRSVRFMVAYNILTVSGENAVKYEYVCERVNELLADKKMRYVDFKRFKELCKQVKQFPEVNSTTFLSRIAQFEKVEFSIEIKITQNTVSISILDNCTALGITKINFGYDEQADFKSEIKKALPKNMEKGFANINTTMLDWAENGRPYELRFYNFDSNFMLEIVNSLNDSGSINEVEQNSIDGYTKIACRSRLEPFKLQKVVLELCDEMEQKAEIKQFFIRQISFAKKTAI